MNDKTMFECLNQDELLVQFKQHIDFTQDCDGALAWVALFIQAYAKVRDVEDVGHQMAIQYEYQQKLDALTGGDK